MLKGHAKIELTNVNTGEMEVYEHDNLVTNAVTKFLNKYASFCGIQNVASGALPIYNKLTNGLLLFQKELEENAENTFLPCSSEDELVGYASNDAYSGTDTKRGSINQNESEEVENGYKYVWDFATSQGNGEISALGLTNYKCGAEPYKLTKYGNLYAVSFSYDLYNKYIENIFDFDFDTYTFTSLHMSTTAILEIAKVQLHYNSIGIKDTLTDIKLINFKSVDLSSNTISLNQNCIWIDGWDGYYYSVYASGTTVTIARIDKTTLKLDEEYGQKSIVLSHTTTIKIHTMPNGFAHRNAAIMKGYIYIIATNSVYKVNLNDVTDIQYKEVSGIVGYGATRYGSQNAIYTVKHIIFEDLTTRENISSGTGILGSDAYDRCIVFSDYGTMFRTASNGSSNISIRMGMTHDYLATINNLATPVTKTAAQTMKITYTLTEVEE